MSGELRTQYYVSKRLQWILVFSLVLTLLALLTSTPNEVFADNNSYTFQGQYTAPACGPRHDFVVGPNTRTIDVVASTIPVNDIVLKLYYGGVVVAEQDTGTSPEPIHYATGNNLATGTYQVEVCPFGGQATLSPSDYAGVVIVTEAPLPGTTPPVTDPVVLAPAPIDAGPRPRYQSHTPTEAQIDAGMTKNSQDEPNIGVNWSSGTVMLQALMQTLRVGFEDQACPQTPPSTWKDVTPVTSQESFDPILFSDHQTNRTFVSHLLLLPGAGASSFTDDDGTNWTPSQGAGVGSGFDHQTLGGGPFHAPVPPLPGYRNAVYYCSQDVAFANCALSVDGGLTFGPAVPMYVLASPDTAIVGQCAGLHGHVKVGPDGTVYVPNASCAGPINPNENGIALSEDNGTTWKVRTIPGTKGGGSDPSVAVDDGGLLYLGFVNDDKIPAVAVSADKGKSWTSVYDIGTMVGVKNAVFPAMVAGSAGRAAVAFYGTTAESPVNNFNSEAVWHLYVAHTYDGGAHWITVNATPNDPIQRGGIHLGGGSQIHRNLLDFFDADLDRFGRMTIGYADGCIGGCVQSPDDARGNSFTAYGTIARQTGGRRLFFGSDSTQPTSPGAPRLTVTRNGPVSTLTWSQSEDGGSPITSYTVYRNEQMIATLSGDARRYVDSSGDATTQYIYRVSATNAAGTSCGTNAAISKPVGSSCGADGLRILEDPSGDQIAAPLEGDMDIQWVSIGEPFFADGSRKLVFKLKVANLASLTPNRMWRILWSYPDAPVAPNPTSTAFVGRYYIGMNINTAGAATFEYGIAQNLSAVVVNASPAERLGAADPESGFNPDGTITLVISADKVGGPGPGDLIGALVARSYPVAQDVTLRGDSASDVASMGSTYALSGNASCGATATCLEDDAAQLAYSSGWHQVSNARASGGHFRVNPSKNGTGSVKLTFDVAAGKTGAVVYHFARSTKGGTADVYVDGVLKSQIVFSGSTGSLNDPVFGFNARFGGLAAGSHTFELRNIKGAAFVDRFCLESAGSNATTTSGPGTTTSVLSNVGPLGSLVQSLNSPAGTQSISVVASGGGLLRVILVDPSGLTLATADGVDGVAVLDTTVSRTGVYQVKVLNLGTSLTQTWTAATPFGVR